MLSEMPPSCFAGQCLKRQVPGLSCRPDHSSHRGYRFCRSGTNWLNTTTVQRAWCRATRGVRACLRRLPWPVGTKQSLATDCILNQVEESHRMSLLPHCRERKESATLKLDQLNMVLNCLRDGLGMKLRQCPQGMSFRNSMQGIFILWLEGCEVEPSEF